MTAQIHENLIYKGFEISMTFCPPLPQWHSRILEASEEEVSKMDGSIFSTACWREYIGTWEIKDERLYLLRLEGRYKLDGDEPLFADWFSGILRVPKGKILHDINMGFASVYEQELHIKVEKGLVTETRIIDNRGKTHDELKLAWRNFPGKENRFPGDDDF